MNDVLTKMLVDSLVSQTKEQLDTLTGDLHKVGDTSRFSKDAEHIKDVSLTIATRLESYASQGNISSLVNLTNDITMLVKSALDELAKILPVVERIRKLQFPKDIWTGNIGRAIAVANQARDPLKNWRVKELDPFLEKWTLPKRN